MMCLGACCFPTHARPGPWPRAFLGLRPRTFKILHEITHTLDNRQGLNIRNSPFVKRFQNSIRMNFQILPNESCRSFCLWEILGVARVLLGVGRLKGRFWEVERPPQQPAASEPGGNSTPHAQITPNMDWILLILGSAAPSIFISAPFSLNFRIFLHKSTPH